MNIIFCFFIAFTLNAQDGTGLQEIDPAKDAVLLRKLEEKKLLKMMAEKKKEEALKAEAKRKVDERIAAEEKKKAELIAAEEKKKKEVEETTRWLISERDRKMKEAAQAEARKTPPVEHKAHSLEGRAHPVSGNRPATNAEGLDWSSRKPPREIHRIQTHGTDYPVTIFPPPQCTFPEKTKFPADVKVLGIATYEGTFPGGRGFRHHPMTDVTLDIQEQGSVGLVLWTYEPIRWTIKMNGGNLVGVLVIGYHEQKINVESEVPTIVSFFQNGRNQCQYSENNYDQQMEYQERAKVRLNKFSQTLFGKPLSSYQYKYTLPPEVKVPDQN